jgi:polar amino acid transport system substrate-binding protein
MTRQRLCLGVLGLVVGLTWPGGLGAEEPPLRWGADLEGGEPFITPDPANPANVVGFEVDLAEALGKALGRTVRHAPAKFDQLIPALNRGDFDFAMNGLEVLPERLQQVRFSRPYYVYKLQLVVREDDKRFGSLADCLAQKATVGTLSGAAAERVLQKANAVIKAYDGQAEIYKELGNGRIDAIYLDTVINATYLRKPDFRALREVGPREHAGYYAIALRPADETLATRIDAALLTFQRDGTLRRIYEKWGIWNADQKELDDYKGYGEADTTDQWPLAKYLPRLLEGAVLTTILAVVSFAVAMALGLIVALARLYGPWPARWLAVGYVEFFRGVPVLILLYFLYFGLSDLGLPLPAFVAAVIGLGLNYAAYEAEVYRAGILGVPAGQWEAAAALGMPPPLAFRRVILPQAIRGILPPMTNDFVALFKDTSVVSIIALEELAKQYQIISKTSLKYIEVGLVTAALYLILAIPLGYLSRYLEARWGEERG